MEIKIVLIAVLLLFFSGGWILSNSDLSKKIVMNDKLFNLTNIVLLVCSVTGFTATLFIGEKILETHLFEIILLPALAAFIITGVSHKSKNAEEKFDEKQQSNMKDAAAFSWMVVIMSVFIIYAAYSSLGISGILFFPLLIFIAFAAYSGSLIYYYKIG